MSRQWTCSILDSTLGVAALPTSCHARVSFGIERTSVSVAFAPECTVDLAPELQLFECGSFWVLKSISHGLIMICYFVPGALTQLISTKSPCNWLCCGEHACWMQPSGHQLRYLRNSKPPIKSTQSWGYPTWFLCPFAEDLWNSDLFSGKGAIHRAFSAILTTGVVLSSLQEWVMLVVSIMALNYIAIKLFCPNCDPNLRCCAEMKTTWNRSLLRGCFTRHIDRDTST